MRNNLIFFIGLSAATALLFHSIDIDRDPKFLINLVQAILALSLTFGMAKYSVKIRGPVKFMLGFGFIILWIGGIVGGLLVRFTLLKASVYCYYTLIGILIFFILFFTIYLHQYLNRLANK